MLFTSFDSWSFERFLFLWDSFWLSFFSIAGITGVRFFCVLSSGFSSSLMHWPSSVYLSNSLCMSICMHARFCQITGCYCYYLRTELNFFVFSSSLLVFSPDIYHHTCTLPLLQFRSFTFLTDILFEHISPSCAGRSITHNFT